MAEDLKAASDLVLVVLVGRGGPAAHREHPRRHGHRREGQRVDGQRDLDSSGAGQGATHDRPDRHAHVAGGLDMAVEDA